MRYRDRLRKRRDLLFLAALCGILVFVLLAPKAFPFSDASDPGDPVVPDLPPVADAVLVVLSLVLLISAVLVRTVVTGIDRENLQQRKPVWMQLIVFGLVLLGIAAFTQVVRERGEESESLPQPSASATEDASGDAAATEPSRALGWVLTGVLASVTIVVAGGTARLIGKTRGGSGDDDDLDPILREIDEGYFRIAADAHPREAVIACYIGMTTALEEAGAVRRPSDTPFEFLERALGRFHVSKGNAHRLTELFEKARFSVHETDEDMRREALSALDAVRAELSAHDIEVLA